MHNVSIAEWMVGRFTSAADAASIVGDLEELRPQKGVLWFWASLAGFLFLLCWRRFAALVVASCLGAQVLEVSPFIFGRTASHYQHRDAWVILFLAVSAVSALLWMMFLYSLIRYGIRDRVTQLAFLWAGVVTAMVVSWWHPVILFFCIILIAALSFLSIASIEDRRRMLALSAAISTAFASFVLATLVIQHRSSPRLPFMTAFFCAWLPAEIWSRLHDRAASLEKDEDTEDPKRASLS